MKRCAAFLEGFEAIQALSRGDVLLSQLVPRYRPTLDTSAGSRPWRASDEGCLKGGKFSLCARKAVTRVGVRHAITSLTRRRARSCPLAQRGGQDPRVQRCDADSRACYESSRG